MDTNQPANPRIAIACGGTGGHLFPGLAVAEVLQQYGCSITLLVSAKEVDQQGVKSAVEMDIVTLPSIALQLDRISAFFSGFWRSFWLCRREFARQRPQAVLAMGSFTSAPPIMAGKMAGAATFLHEANAIPGRANRLLAPFADEAFVGFPMAANRLKIQSVTVTGTPVRPQFKDQDTSACRMALGLDANRPVLLIMGGSQGASRLNELMGLMLPLFMEQAPELQFLHITGNAERDKVRAAYADRKCRAVVLPFLTEMELALGAATVAISRAGASSMAELAAVQVPSILIPYPYAADNHQLFNARCFSEKGAAVQIAQKDASPEKLAQLILDLLKNQPKRDAVKAALQNWYFPDAATRIAGAILKRTGIDFTEPARDFVDEPPLPRTLLRPSTKTGQAPMTALPLFSK